MWWSLDRADALADVSMAAGGIVAGDQGALPAGLDRKRGKACRFYGTAAGTYFRLFLWVWLYCLFAFVGWCILIPMSLVGKGLVEVA